MPTFSHITNKPNLSGIKNKTTKKNRYNIRCTYVRPKEIAPLAAHLAMMHYLIHQVFLEYTYHFIFFAKKLSFSFN